MFNVADLPAVREQLARDAAAAKEQGAGAPADDEVVYARAPEVSGPQQTGARPPAIQGSTR